MLGVIELRDQAAIEQIQPALERAATTTRTRLLGHVSDTDLSKLGIDDNTLRAAVPSGPDDMFIVGDAHQRIYDNHVSLARVGVNV